MPGPGAKDAKAAKTLPEATPKASELHGEAIKPELRIWHLKPLAWAEDLHVKKLEKVKTTTKGSRSYRSHTNQSEDYQSL
jgi:hypothetical protein